MKNFIVHALMTVTLLECVVPVRCQFDLFWPDHVTDITFWIVYLVFLILRLPALTSFLLHDRLPTPSPLKRT